MRIATTIFFLLLSFIVTAQQSDLLQYVNPLIGTDRMGHMYPVAPGSDRYDLGSPLVKEAVLNLENGKTFTVTTVNQSAGNVYVRKVELNGKKLDRTWITHEEIMNGGTLVFYME